MPRVITPIVRVKYVEMVNERKISENLKHSIAGVGGALCRWLGGANWKGPDAQGGVPYKNHRIVYSTHRTLRCHVGVAICRPQIARGRGRQVAAPTNHSISVLRDDVGIVPYGGRSPQTLEKIC